MRVYKTASYAQWQRGFCLRTIKYAHYDERGVSDNTDKSKRAGLHKAKMWQAFLVSARLTRELSSSY